LVLLVPQDRPYMKYCSNIILQMTLFLDQDQDSTFCYKTGPEYRSCGFGSGSDSDPQNYDSGHLW